MNLDGLKQRFCSHDWKVNKGRKLGEKKRKCVKCNSVQVLTYDGIYVYWEK